MKIENIEKKNTQGLVLLIIKERETALKVFGILFWKKLNAGEVGRRDVGNFCGPGINYL